MATQPLRQEGFELGWKKFAALKKREQKLLIGKQQQQETEFTKNGRTEKTKQMFWVCTFILSDISLCKSLIYWEKN